MNYNNSPLLEKSLKFASRVVKLYKYLHDSKKETIISKQLLRSATSIGANANEAAYALSKSDFIFKLHISLKECAETEYWLRLLEMSDYITEEEAQSIINDCLEVKRILVASLNTAKSENKDSE
ncbi:MAG: four helix bundle protein [Clostridia bacterium]|nr:four helix bundle protein [Clostridia bacterium]MBQ4562733.1 four helix bundle protein [Clostridia bacterium]